MTHDLYRELATFDITDKSDYEGGTFSFMEPCENGGWVNAGDHWHLVRELRQRITYLENVCAEQTRMLTGD